jgi:hypothetical protein
MNEDLTTYNLNPKDLPNISISSGTNGDSQLYINNITISKEIAELLLQGKTLEITAGRGNLIKIKIT